MEAYLVKILTDNPWLIWVSLGLIVILAVVSVLRGGEVNLFGLKFGTKSPNPQSPANVSASGHTALSSHQTMPISIYTGPVDLDDKLIEKVYFRVKEKLDLENSSRPSYLDLLKGYPQPSSDYLLASSAQYAVRKKFEELKTIVYGDQTGWLLQRDDDGFRIFPEYASWIKDANLVEEMQVLDHLLEMVTWTPEIHEETIRHIMILSIYILRKLDNLIASEKLRNKKT